MEGLPAGGLWSRIHITILFEEICIAKNPLPQRFETALRFIFAEQNVKEVGFLKYCYSLDYVSRISYLDVRKAIIAMYQLLSLVMIDDDR